MIVTTIYFLSSAMVFFFVAYFLFWRISKKESYIFYAFNPYQKSGELFWECEFGLGFLNLIITLIAVIIGKIHFTFLIGLVYLLIGLYRFYESEKRQSDRFIPGGRRMRIKLPDYWGIFLWLLRPIWFWLYFHIGSLLAYKHNKRVMKEHSSKS